MNRAESADGKGATTPPQNQTEPRRRAGARTWTASERSEKGRRTASAPNAETRQALTHRAGRTGSDNGQGAPPLIGRAPRADATKRGARRILQNAMRILRLCALASSGNFAKSEFCDSRPRTETKGRPRPAPGKDSARTHAQASRRAPARRTDKQHSPECVYPAARRARAKHKGGVAFY